MLSLSLALLIAAPQTVQKIPQIDHLSEGRQADAPAGTALAPVGDWDGDGTPDYVVGIPDYVGSQLFGPELDDMGWVEVRSGVDGSLLTFYSDSSLVDGNGFSLAPRLGEAVAGEYTVGLFGSPAFAVGLPGVREVRVIVQSPFTTGLSVAAVLAGDNSFTLDDQSFGSVVENVGDLTGDGLPELAVGSPKADLLLPDPFGGPPIVLADIGRVRVFDGNGFAEIGDWTFTSSGEEFGSSICGIADVTGDGLRDLAVGAPGLNEGSVYLIDPTQSGAAAIVAQIQGTSDGERFGSDIASLGDLDGGGRDELFIGAGGFTIGTPPFALPRGRAAAFDGESLTELWSRTGLTFGHLGESVAAVDLDGDGARSAIVNDSTALAVTPTKVRALDGWTGEEELSWDAWPADRETDLASARDVNGDGGEELLIGLPELDFGRGGQLCVRQFLGTPGGSGSNSTWTVDDDGPADFDSIAVAALVVGSGDTLLVEPGTYADAVITRPLDVLGTSELFASTEVASLSVVGAATVRLSKLALAGLSIDGVPGRATLSDLLFDGAAPARIVASNDVVVAGSTFATFVPEGLSGDGPNALEIADSDVQLNLCSFQPSAGAFFGDDGGDGVRISGSSRVWSFDSTARGGDGNDGNPEFFFDGGNGGDGFDVRSGSILDLRGRQTTVVEGGDRGWSFTGSLEDGFGVRTEEGATLDLSINLTQSITLNGLGVTLSGPPPPSVTYAPVWGLGTTTNVAFASPLGSVQVLLFSAGAANLELPTVLGTPVWIDLAQLNVPLAPVVELGFGPETPRIYPFPIPTTPTLAGYEFHLQGLLYDAVTGLFEGSAGGAVRIGL